MCELMAIIMAGAVVAVAIQKSNCVGNCFGCLVWIVVVSIAMTMVGLI